MSVNDLRVRVTVSSACALAALALPAAWMGGPTAGLGLLGGGAIAVLNFWWLARGAGMLGAGAGHARVATAVTLAGLRFLALLAALVAVWATGWAHPVAIVLGLTVLPAVVVVEGLRLTRQALTP